MRSPLFYALVLRLVVMAFFYHPDLKSQHFHASFLGQGVVNIYSYLAQNRTHLPYTDTFNYPPAAYLFLGSYNWIAQLFSGPGLQAWLNDWQQSSVANPNIFSYLLLLKFPYLLADLAVGVLLLREKKSTLLLWLFNPISLYAIYAQGQFDILPALTTVAAYYLVLHKRLWPAALVLGLGAALKTYPLLLLPFVLMRSKSLPQAITVTVAALGTYLVFLVPFISSPAAREAIFASGLSQRLFSLSWPLGFGESLLPYFVLYFGLWLYSWSRHFDFDLLPEFLATTLSVLLLSHFHPQWAIWPLPFVVLALTRLPKLLFPALLGMAGYFGTIFLLADQFVLVGLFSALNPQLLALPTISSLISPIFSPLLLQSIAHTCLTVCGLWIIYQITRSHAA